MHLQSFKLFNGFAFCFIKFEHLVPRKAYRRHTTNMHRVSNYQGCPWCGHYPLVGLTLGQSSALSLPFFLSPSAFIFPRGPPMCAVLAGSGYLHPHFPLSWRVLIYFSRAVSSWGFGTQCVGAVSSEAFSKCLV